MAEEQVQHGGLGFGEERVSEWVVHCIHIRYNRIQK
jgi:aspartyl/asparaginyl-tRNA synthetase